MVNSNFRADSSEPPLMDIFFYRQLYQRAIDFANLNAGLNVELPGQEGFTIIQYNPADEYHPRTVTTATVKYILN